MKDTEQKNAGRHSGLQMALTNYRSEIGVFIALILYCAVISVLSPYFLTSRNMLNLFSQLSVVGLLAIGEIFVLLTGGIDLSVGNTMGLSCMAGGMVMASTQNMAAGIIVALAVGLGCGIVNGFLVGYVGLPAFIVTLGMMDITRNADYLLCGGVGVNNLPEAIKNLTKVKLFGINAYYFIIVLLFILTGWILNNTKLGRNTYAIGSNKNAARLSGVNTKLATLLPYVISGLFSGIGAVVLMSRFAAVDPNYGSGYEMNAIAACVVGGASLAGGKGSMLGTFIGVVLMACISNGLDILGVSPYWQGVTIGCVIIGVLLIETYSEKVKSKSKSKT